MKQMIKIFIVFIWALAMILAVDPIFEMISAKSTIENITGIIIGFLLIVVTIKTNFLTSIFNRK